MCGLHSPHIMQQHQGRWFSQYFAAISASVIVAAAGSCIAWPSPILKKFASGETAFQLSQAEAAWIVSLKNVGNLLAPLPAGLLMARAGRRTALLCAAVPFLASWALVVVSTSAAPLYLARILGGVGVGMAFTITPVYLGEIAHDMIRGALTTLMQAMLYVGIVFEYSVGPHVSYIALAVTSCAIPILFIALFALQPESPAYLVSRGKIEGARRALVRLRGSQDAADEEIRVLERREASLRSAGLLEAVRDLRIRRALVIVVVLQVLKELSGNSAVVAYAAPTLSRGSRHGDSYTIVLGLAMLASTVICSQLVDRAGRRPLLLTSCCVSSVALASTAFAMTGRTDIPDWLPLASLIVYGVAFSLGLAPIPSALIAELFPAEMREVAAATASASLSLASLIVTKLFQLVADRWGLDVVFLSFSTSCFAGAIFVYFVLPETKCKTLEEIQLVLHPDKGDRKVPLIFTYVRSTSLLQEEPAMLKGQA